MEADSSRCIYCLETKPRHAFNTEHVVPFAFGGFEGALTMTREVDPRVCKQCNSRFGDTLDRVFARDSFEALLRLTLGMKPPEGIAQLGRTRVNLQLSSDSALGPVHLELAVVDDEGTLALLIRPQVRFHLAGGGFLCLTEEQLRTSDPRLLEGVDTSRKDIFWSRQHGDAYERILALLAGYGISFTPGAQYTPPVSPEELEVTVNSTIDVTIRRAVARIAYNYTAKVTWSTAPSFIFSKDFDPVRAFILEGEGDPTSFVRLMPLREQDRDLDSRSRKGRSHLLVVSWDPHDDIGILGTVVLFSQRPYDVRLCRKPSGVWIDLRSGHEYSLATMKVSPIPSGRYIIPPRGYSWDASAS